MGHHPGPGLPSHALVSRLPAPRGTQGRVVELGFRVSVSPPALWPSFLSLLETFPLFRWSPSLRLGLGHLHSAVSPGHRKLGWDHGGLGRVLGQHEEGGC